jgi:addiction module HigA family antidote
MSKTLTPITPGEILLEEFLKPLGISQNELAKAICVPPNRISQIVNGKREITADTALRLGMFFGIEPEFWLNLQASYNMKMARNLIGEELEKTVKIYKPNASDLAHSHITQ